MLTDNHAAEREYVLRSARDFDVKFILNSSSTSTPNRVVQSPYAAAVGTR